MNSLEIKNLRVNAGTKEILAGVNLTINSGRVQVLMGPNGGGKSTLAMAVTGAPGYRIMGGEIILKEGKKSINILKLPTEKRAKAGIFMSFQNPVAIPGVSVFELLRLALRSKHGRTLANFVEFFEQIKNSAESLGLREEFLKRSINEGFSGGERKKAETLQLLTIKPKIAILDELDTGLDLEALKMVAKGVNLAAREGAGILMITHNPRVLEYIKPEKIFVLAGGVITRSGGEELVGEIEEKGYEKVFQT